MIFSIFEYVGKLRLVFVFFVAFWLGKLNLVVLFRGVLMVVFCEFCGGISFRFFFRILVFKVV